MSLISRQKLGVARPKWRCGGERPERRPPQNDEPDAHPQTQRGYWVGSVVLVEDFIVHGLSGLLPDHGDAEAFLGVDEVVVVVTAEVELDPVDLAGEPAAAGAVVGSDGGSRLVADVGRLVG
jgi:hypothetical protein